MAQFRTSADVLDSILLRSGENISGTSAFESRALEYLNKIHHAVIAGGNEFNLEVNETWDWARSPRPLVLELQPKYDTGTVSLTKGSQSGSFSSAVTNSLVGWHLKVIGRSGYFRIIKHSAGGTAFELDGAYDSDTGATLSYVAMKLDYELVPSHLIVDENNNKIDFEETVATELTATLTTGSYTPSALAAELATQLNSAGASTYTVTYSENTKKFTLASDLGGGGGTFKLLCASGTNALIGACEIFGFDIEDQATAAAHVSTYVLGGISRLIEPIRIYRGASKEGNIYGMDAARFQRDYPLVKAREGYPDRFTKIKESADGIITIRINKYPEVTTRVELEWVPVPIDLKDNAASIPKVPRKLMDVLEYGASAYLLLEKEDSKWEMFFKLAGDKLEAAMLANRAELYKDGINFAQTVAREDLDDGPRSLMYGYTWEDQ